MKNLDMFSAQERIILPVTDCGPLITQQDFNTDISYLVNHFSIDELVANSRALAYHSDIIGDVFYDEMPENLRKSFQEQLNKQKALEKEKLDNAEIVRKLKEHFQAVKTGVDSPHKEFIHSLIGEQKAPNPPEVE